MLLNVSTSKPFDLKLDGEHLRCLPLGLMFPKQHAFDCELKVALRLTFLVKGKYLHWLERLVRGF